VLEEGAGALWPGLVGLSADDFGTAPEAPDVRAVRGG
jgi:hypothetical protein